MKEPGIPDALINFLINQCHRAVGGLCESASLSDRRRNQPVRSFNRVLRPAIENYPACISTVWRCGYGGKPVNGDKAVRTAIAKQIGFPGRGKDVVPGQFSEDGW